MIMVSFLAVACLRAENKKAADYRACGWLLFPMVQDTASRPGSVK
jgi:hypothetical protein